MQPTSTRVPELPTLEPGCIAFEGDTRGALHALVADHLCAKGGRAIWVDSRGHARTDVLARVAPSDRLLERVDVARAFTPYQHYRLLEVVETALRAGGVRGDPSVIVVPALDWFYASDECGTQEGRAMAMTGLERLSALASEQDLPIICTTAGTALEGCVDTMIDTTLTCQSTSFGPRFTGDGIETVVYRVPGGVQTTFAFWREVLAARHPQVGTGTAESASPTPVEGAYGAD